MALWKQVQAKAAIGRSAGELAQIINAAVTLPEIAQAEAVEILPLPSETEAGDYGTSTYHQALILFGRPARVDVSGSVHTESGI